MQVPRANFQTFPAPKTPANEQHAQEESPTGPTLNNGETRRHNNDAVRTPGYSLVDEGAQGCKRHLVEFIDQEGLSYKPIEKAARITYVGQCLVS